MTREEIGEKLTIELGNSVLETIKKWLDSHDGEYDDSILVASVMTGIVLSYESIAQGFGIKDAGYGFLHEFIMRARNRKSET